MDISLRWVGEGMGSKSKIVPFLRIIQKIQENNRFWVSNKNLQSILKFLPKHHIIDLLKIDQITITTELKNRRIRLKRSTLLQIKKNKFQFLAENI